MTRRVSALLTFPNNGHYGALWLSSSRISVSESLATLGLNTVWQSKFTFSTIRKTQNRSKVLHVATYWLPRVKDGGIRLHMTITARQQVSSRDSDGYLLSGPHASILHVQFRDDRYTPPRRCQFFTPVNRFIDESLRLFSLHPTQRLLVTPQDRPWSSWGNTSTRWVEKNGPRWHKEVQDNSEGSGSRYAFAQSIVDFSPLEIAREVCHYRRSHSLATTSFPSAAKGWITHCYRVTNSQILGANVMLEEDIVSSLPYLEKKIDGMPEYEMFSRVALVNNTIVFFQVS